MIYLLCIFYNYNMGKPNNNTVKIQKYTVQKIVDQKNISGKKYFLIKWQGYPASQNTWQPKENIQLQPITQQSTNKKTKPKPQKIVIKPRLTRQRIKQKQKIKHLKIRLQSKKSMYFASKQKQEQYEMQQIKKKQQNDTIDKKLKEFNKSINKKHKTKRIKKIVKSNGNKQQKIKKVKEEDSSEKNEQIAYPQNTVEIQQLQQQRQSQQIKITQKIVQEQLKLIQQQQSINIGNNDQQPKQQQQQLKKCPLELINQILEKQLHQLNQNHRIRRNIKKKEPYEVKDIKSKPRHKKNNNIIHWRTKAKRLNETTQLYRINVSEQYRQLILSKPPRIEQQGKQQIQQQIIQSSSESINDQNIKTIPEDIVNDVLGQTKKDFQKLYKIELFDGSYRQISHENLKEFFPKKLCDYQEKRIKYLEQLNS